MAVNVADIQKFLGADDGERSEFGSDSGRVGRSWIDGTLVVYDPEDCPKWLADVLARQNEDGDTNDERVSGVWERQAA
jgi:hypothetical protein